MGLNGKRKARCAKCCFKYTVDVFEISNPCPKCGNNVYIFLDKDRIGDWKGNEERGE